MKRPRPCVVIFKRILTVQSSVYGASVRLDSGAVFT